MFNTSTINNDKYLIIDGDSLIYQATHSGKDLNFEYAVSAFEEKLNWIFLNCFPFCDKYIILLTEKLKQSFRYAIYPEYKANRKDREILEHLPGLYHHVISNYNAYVDEYYEADDCVGILHKVYGDSSVIACIDHDIYQLEGVKYNYHYKARIDVVDKKWADREYYTLMFGDAGDNIKPFTNVLKKEVKEYFGLKNVKGLGEASINLILKDCDSPLSYIKRIVKTYQLQFGEDWKNQLRLIISLVDLRNHKQDARFEKIASLQFSPIVVRQDLLEPKTIEDEEFNLPF
jgi:hypothetical protein